MLKTDDQESLGRLINDIRGSTKYKDISPDLITSIGSQEIIKRRTFKEAVKATRNKLHQIGGAYLDGRQNYTQWLDELSQATQSGNKTAMLQVCRTIMSHHASTRERLPILDQFYSTILSNLPPIHSIIDIACGLNPLSIPWMPLESGTAYYAYDIYQDMIDFLSYFFPLHAVKGYSQQCDIIQSCPTHEVDLAFVLKAIPCLEQIDKQAGYRLLHTLNAKYLVVSFPVHSLGGRSKGMSAYYEEHFRALIRHESWEVQRIEFATELVFVIKKTVVR